MDTQYTYKVMIGKYTNDWDLVRIDCVESNLEFGHATLELGKHFVSLLGGYRCSLLESSTRHKIVRKSYDNGDFVYFVVSVEKDLPL